MTTLNTSQIDLTGAGAAYIRVSTDQQDTERQYASLHEFERRHGVTIAKHHWYEDQGWARDTADQRPDFQRLLKLAETNGVRWIVVDRLDRFGTKNAKQLITYLYRLDEYGCKLFDAAGKEWTGEDIATVITAVVEGARSKGEQTEKSCRVLDGKITKARAGEWQGGPVRLGFDVVCYSRATGNEVWRVVYEGRDKRLKVFPDGRTERFDGERNFPKSQPVTDVMRVAPSRDKAKISAAVSVFKRYATESISFTALAHHLNGLGFRSSYGGMFHGHHVGRMLEDPIYIGYCTWNRTHHGKFHRFRGGRAEPDLNYKEKVTANDKSDWIQSAQLFKPLVDPKTWAAVQVKLARRTKRPKAPSTPALYLSGLVFCGNCAGRMVAGPTRRKTKKRNGNTDGRLEYMCGTYHKAVREGKRTECKCLRNSVFQDTLEPHIDRYLEESGTRLELLTAGLDADNLTDRLRGQEDDAWDGFTAGVARLETYLARHHPDEYDALRREYTVPQEEGGPGPEDFVADVLKCYRANFDPAALSAEIQRLDEEHTTLTHRYADLPTPRAREKARGELEALEKRIEELERQRTDTADVVEQHYRQMLDLQMAIREAKIALRAGAGERAMRQRAEAVRAVVQRIECTFTATGKTKWGPGNTHARLVSVTIFPVTGDPTTLAADPPGNVLPRTSVVRRW